MNYTRSIRIHAPAEHVWSILIDVERWPEWTASISSVRRLEQGPISVGSRARVKQPKLASMIWTVVGLEPMRTFTWTAISGGVTTLAEHEITSDPDGTVTVTLSFRQTGVLAPIVGLFAAGLTRRYVDMEAEGLKRRSEAGSPVPAA